MTALTTLIYMIFFSNFSAIKNENNFSKSKQKSRNKLMHITNGNHKKTFGIKFFHLNKPDIISLSEANIFKNDTFFINQFPDYNFIFDNLWDKLGWSRQVIMINKNIDYQRRLDLENENQSIIWIEIPIKNSKNLLVVKGYRQW